MSTKRSKSFLAMLLNKVKEIIPPNVYSHVKSKQNYTVCGYAYDTNAEEPCIIYVDNSCGITFTRPASQFTISGNDARFVTTDFTYNPCNPNILLNVPQFGCVDHDELEDILMIIEDIRHGRPSVEYLVQLQQDPSYGFRFRLVHGNRAGEWATYTQVARLDDRVAITEYYGHEKSALRPMSFTEYMDILRPNKVYQKDLMAQHKIDDDAKCPHCNQTLDEFGGVTCKWADFIPPATAGMTAEKVQLNEECSHCGNEFNISHVYESGIVKVDI